MAVRGRMVKVLDPRSKGLAPVMYKRLVQALDSHCLWPPNGNGYLVERKMILCEWHQLPILPSEMLIRNNEFKY